MQTQPYSPHVEIEQIAQRILKTQKITRADQQLLFSFLRSQEILNFQEQRLVRQVADRLQKGFLTVMD